jgi:hypothetical protein
MKPSEYLEYFKEHPHIKKKEAEMLAGRILSNYGSSYNVPAMVTAMEELEKAISIVDMIETKQAKEVADQLQGAYNSLSNKYHNG